MIADRIYHLDADGQVVEELDPQSRTLLVGAYCEIADDLAAHYGLPLPADPVAPVTPSDKAEQPAETDPSSTEEPDASEDPGVLATIGAALECAVEDAADVVEAIAENITGKAQRPASNKALKPDEDK